LTRFTALFLTVLTGFSGLVYEVAWQKYVATLLGSHAEATAAVLAIFLGGLSVGYAIFGRATQRLVQRSRQRSRSPRLLLFYALVESGIGVYVLLFPWLFGVAQALSLLGPVGEAGLGFAFDVVLAALLIGPPAVLMGGTIPILTLGLAGSRERATRIHAWIYGFNTAGAFAGALAGAFVLIPRLGLDGALYAMGSVNILAGVIFALLDRFGQRVEPTLESARGASAAPLERFGAYAAVAALAGFAMMALQTTLNRIGGLAFGSSHFTFAIVVAVFVLCIALGSLAVSALRNIPRGVVVGSQWALVLLLLILYHQIEDAPYWAHVLRALFQPVRAAFYPFYLASFAGIFLVLAIPIGLSGALLPLLFHHLRGEVGDLGSVAGRLYSWNTVGSLLGALLGGYILLFWLDLHHIYRIALAALVVQSALLTTLVFRVSPGFTALLVVLPALGSLWSLPDWEPERLASGLFRDREPAPISFAGPDVLFRKEIKNEFIFYDDGPTATVSVREGPRKKGRLNRGISNNGKSDGHLIGDYPTMSLAGLLPALLAERPERCFVIGYGTGVTAGELAALEWIREVDVAEISQGVIDAAPLFDEGNLNASKNPKVTIIRGDAYRTLLRTRRQYDIIVSEPSNPWVTGVEMLFSREFLEAARGQLSPGGVYVQWFHLYEVDVQTVELVLRTYASVFPNVSVWYALGSDLLLLGSDSSDRVLDLSALERRFERPDFAAGFERSGIESVAALLAHELLPVGTLHAARLDGPVHTLRHPILSDMAARAFFLGVTAQLPKLATPRSAEVGFRNSLLRRYIAGREPSSAEHVMELAVRETCKRRRRFECATLLADWRRSDASSKKLETLLAELREEFPKAAMLTEDYLESLGVLFGASRLRELDEAKSVARLETIGRKFLEHYHHVVPFDRRILRSARSKCSGEGCELVWRSIEELVGRLDAPIDGRIRRRGASARRRGAKEDWEPMSR